MFLLACWHSSLISFSLLFLPLLSVVYFAAALQILEYSSKLLIVSKNIVQATKDDVYKREFTEILREIGPAVVRLMTAAGEVLHFSVFPLSLLSLSLLTPLFRLLFTHSLSLLSKLGKPMSLERLHDSARDSMLTCHDRYYSWNCENFCQSEQRKGIWERT